MSTLTKSNDMTQQEIFENMTRGKLATPTDRLFIGGNLSVFVEKSGQEFVNSREMSFVHSGLKADQRIIAQKANCNAIVSAINNTYGKGINPEGIAEMKRVLEVFSIAIFPNLPKDGESLLELYQGLAKKALALAELK